MLQLVLKHWLTAGSLITHCIIIINELSYSYVHRSKVGYLCISISEVSVIFEFITAHVKIRSVLVIISLVLKLFNKYRLRKLSFLNNF